MADLTEGEEIYNRLVELRQYMYTEYLKILDRAAELNLSRDTICELTRLAGELPPPEGIAVEGEGWTQEFIM